MPGAIADFLARRARPVSRARLQRLRGYLWDRQHREEEMGRRANLTRRIDAEFARRLWGLSGGPTLFDLAEE